MFLSQPPTSCSDSPATPDLSHNQLFWLGKDYSNLITKDWVQLDRPFEGEGPLKVPKSWEQGQKLGLGLRMGQAGSRIMQPSFQSAPPPCPKYLQETVPDLSPDSPGTPRFHRQGDHTSDAMAGRGGGCPRPTRPGPGPAFHPALELQQGAYSFLWRVEIEREPGAACRLPLTLPSLHLRLPRPSTRHPCTPTCYPSPPAPQTSSPSYSQGGSVPLCR